MLVYSIVLLAAVVVAVGATENLSSDQVTEEAYSGLFTIGKHTYASQEDFIHSGKRDVEQETLPKKKCMKWSKSLQAWTG